MNKAVSLIGIKVAFETIMFSIYGMTSTIAYSLLRPSCASQPIRLHRNLIFFANLITYFVNMFIFYYVKSLSKPLKWSMRLFSTGGEKKTIIRS